MHKCTKWAHKIISLQDNEGKWGWFHSLGQHSNSPMTTEQALRRLQYLGFTAADDCIQKAISYMNDCLTGKKEIPDRKEKVQDWPVFSSLILATWIRRFVKDNAAANHVAQQWAEIITSAFGKNQFDYQEYVDTYSKVFRTPPKGARMIGFTNFYPISLVAGLLSEKTENAFIEYILNNESGIYYVYENKISAIPKAFQSKNTSRYLAAIELLLEYESSRDKLRFVAEWLKENQNSNGKWDMSSAVNDKVYFPLSNDWRKAETRENDCTERITKILNKLI